MGNGYGIWTMLAGVAFFLLAMAFMEDSLRSLTGRRFKLFLKRQTTRPAKAVLGGALVSALLQSSSIVNLLVLSMVGAGVVQMSHALALMLGSNIGTTFTSWMLVTFGFEFGIEQWMLPVTAISGIIMAFLDRESKWFAWCRFVFSLSFLFVALMFIKTGMEGWVADRDLQVYAGYPLVVFVLVGLVITGLVQSSSATVAITLSALHSDAISLIMAMAIVLGSEIGTTLKLFLASAGGLPGKKRVALGNFLFNMVTVLFLLLLLRPTEWLISEYAGIKDHLFALVFFQSMINFLSLLLFFPFLKPVSRFLMKRYTDDEDDTMFISKVSVADSGIALDALEKEMQVFVRQVVMYNAESFDVSDQLPVNMAIDSGFADQSLSGKYDHIKILHGEMYVFSMRLNQTVISKDEADRLNRYVAASRNFMYAAKNIRDAQQDILQLRHSSNDVKYRHYLESADNLVVFYRQVSEVLHAAPENRFAFLTRLYRDVSEAYAQNLSQLYQEPSVKLLSELEISTLINFNRELYTSFKSMIFGLKDFLLSPAEADYFDDLPGFIR
ncbi:MAG TPA: Na/Pi symporter [Ferruginibacter sp.]|nr:Na/Pi symporter [Ferruginibacter sp.]